MDPGRRRLQREVLERERRPLSAGGDHCADPRREKYSIVVVVAHIFLNQALCMVLKHDTLAPLVAARLIR